MATAKERVLELHEELIITEHLTIHREGAILHEMDELWHRIPEAEQNAIEWMLLEDEGGYERMD